MSLADVGTFLEIFGKLMVYSWVVYCVGSNVNNAILLISKGFVKLFKKLVHKK